MKRMAMFEAFLNSLNNSQLVTTEEIHQYYLQGESYGTARSALLAGELMGAGPEKADTMGISVSGIFLLGSYFIEKLPVEASATDLITMGCHKLFP